MAWRYAFADLLTDRERADRAPRGRLRAATHT